MSAPAFARELERYGPAATTRPPAREEALAYCRRLARRHYENFSVVSWLLPRAYRQHLYNVYAYCRWADDLADEVDDSRRSLELLDWWRQQLEDCYAGRARHPVFVALAGTIEQFDVPARPFADLLEAFTRDQRQQRYASWDELLDYCGCSANPVGRIVLQIAGSHDAGCCALSDSVCTGLQLANFCQDVARDYRRGRIYLPQEACRQFGYAETDFAAGTVNDAWRGLLEDCVQHAERRLGEGWPLAGRIAPDFRFQVVLFIQGGLAILRQIRRARYDVWTRRPTLSKATKLGLLLTAWRSGRRA